MSLLETDKTPSKPSFVKQKTAYTALRQELASIINNIEQFTSPPNPQPSPNQPKAKPSPQPKSQTASIHQGITLYKKHILAIDNKLKQITASSSITLSEAAFTSKKATLLTLEIENKSLKLIYNNQTKGLLQYQSNAHSNEHLLMNIDKIIQLKEDLKAKRAVHKGTVATIQAQARQIEVLDRKCLLIKENMAFRHRQELKVKKDIYTNDKLQYDIGELRMVIEKKELQLSTEAKRCSLLVRSQKDKINQLTQEIGLISNQINQREKIRRIKENEMRIRLNLIQQLNQAYHSKNSVLTEKEVLKMNSRNNSLSARQNEYSHPQGLISKGNYHKVFEVEKLINENNISAEGKKKKSYQKSHRSNAIIKEIESLKLDIVRTIEQDSQVHSNKKYNQLKHRTIDQEQQSKEALCRCDLFK